MGRVIAGYDGSNTSRAALAWAVRQAELHHAKLQVITVVDPVRRTTTPTKYEHGFTRTSVGSSAP